MTYMCFVVYKRVKTGVVEASTLMT